MSKSTTKIIWIIVGILWFFLLLGNIFMLKSAIRSSTTFTYYDVNINDNMYGTAGLPYVRLKSVIPISKQCYSGNENVGFINYAVALNWIFMFIYMAIIGYYGAKAFTNDD